MVAAVLLVLNLLAGHIFFNVKEVTVKLKVALNKSLKGPDFVDNNKNFQ